MSAVVAQQPDVPGYISGVIHVEPLTLQCRTCGDVTSHAEPAAPRGAGAFVILSGFHFHGCDGLTGQRMCPPCLAAAIARCPKARCKS